MSTKGKASAKTARSPSSLGLEDLDMENPVRKGVEAIQSSEQYSQTDNKIVILIDYPLNYNEAAPLLPGGILFDKLGLKLQTRVQLGLHFSIPEIAPEETSPPKGKRPTSGKKSATKSTTKRNSYDTTIAHTNRHPDLESAIAHFCRTLECASQENVTDGSNAANSIVDSSSLLCSDSQLEHLQLPEMSYSEETLPSQFVECCLATAECVLQVTTEVSDYFKEQQLHGQYRTSVFASKTTIENATRSLDMYNSLLDGMISNSRVPECAVEVPSILYALRESVANTIESVEPDTLQEIESDSPKAPENPNGMIPEIFTAYDSANIAQARYSRPQGVHMEAPLDGSITLETAETCILDICASSLGIIDHTTMKKTEKMSTCTTATEPKQDNETDELSICSLPDDLLEWDAYANERACFAVSSQETPNQLNPDPSSTEQGDHRLPMVEIGDSNVEFTNVRETLILLDLIREFEWLLHTTDCANMLRDILVRRACLQDARMDELELIRRFNMTRLALSAILSPEGLKSAAAAARMWQSAIARQVGTAQSRGAAVPKGIYEAALRELPFEYKREVNKWLLTDWSTARVGMAKQMVRSLLKRHAKTPFADLICLSKPSDYHCLWAMHTFTPRARHKVDVFDFPSNLYGSSKMDFTSYRSIFTQQSDPAAITARNSSKQIFQTDFPLEWTINGSYALTDTNKNSQTTHHRIACRTDWLYLADNAVMRIDAFGVSDTRCKLQLGPESRDDLEGNANCDSITSKSTSKSAQTNSGNFGSLSRRLVMYTDTATLIMNPVRKLTDHLRGYTTHPIPMSAPSADRFPTTASFVTADHQRLCPSSRHHTGPCELLIELDGLGDTVNIGTIPSARARLCATGPQLPDHWLSFPSGRRACERWLKRRKGSAFHAFSLQQIYELSPAEQTDIIAAAASDIKTLKPDRHGICTIEYITPDECITTLHSNGSTSITCVADVHKILTKHSVQQSEGKDLPVGIEKDRYIDGVTGAVTCFFTCKTTGTISKTGTMKQTIFANGSVVWWIPMLFVKYSKAVQQILEIDSTSNDTQFDSWMDSVDNGVWYSISSTGSRDAHWTGLSSFEWLRGLYSSKTNGISDSDFKSKNFSVSLNPSRLMSTCDQATGATVYVRWDQYPLYTIEKANISTSKPSFDTDGMVNPLSTTAVRSPVFTKGKNHILMKFLKQHLNIEHVSHIEQIDGLLWNDICSLTHDPNSQKKQTAKETQKRENMQSTYTDDDVGYNGLSLNTLQRTARVEFLDGSTLAIFGDGTHIFMHANPVQRDTNIDESKLSSMPQGESFEYDRALISKKGIATIELDLLYSDLCDKHAHGEQSAAIAAMMRTRTVVVCPDTTLMAADYNPSSTTPANGRVRLHRPDGTIALICDDSYSEFRPGNLNDPAIQLESGIQALRYGHPIQRSLPSMQSSTDQELIGVTRCFLHRGEVHIRDQLRNTFQLCSDGSIWGCVTGAVRVIGQQSNETSTLSDALGKHGYTEFKLKDTHTVFPRIENPRYPLLLWMDDTGRAAELLSPNVWNAICNASVEYDGNDMSAPAAFSALVSPSPTKRPDSSIEYRNKLEADDNMMVNDKSYDVCSMHPWQHFHFNHELNYGDEVDLPTRRDSNLSVEGMPTMKHIPSKKAIARYHTFVTPLHSVHATFQYQSPGLISFDGQHALSACTYGWIEFDDAAVQRLLRRNRPTREAIFGKYAMKAPSWVDARSDSTALRQYRESHAAEEQPLRGPESPSTVVDENTLQNQDNIISQNSNVAEDQNRPFSVIACEIPQVLIPYDRKTSVQMLPDCARQTWIIQSIVERNKISRNKRQAFELDEHAAQSWRQNIEQSAARFEYTDDRTDEARQFQIDHANQITKLRQAARQYKDQIVRNARRQTKKLANAPAAARDLNSQALIDHPVRHDSNYVQPMDETDNIQATLRAALYAEQNIEDDTVDTSETKDDIDVPMLGTSAVVEAYMPIDRVRTRQELRARFSANTQRPSKVSHANEQTAEAAKASSQTSLHHPDSPSSVIYSLSSEDSKLYTNGSLSARSMKSEQKDVDRIEIIDETNSKEENDTDIQPVENEQSIHSKFSQDQTSGESDDFMEHTDNISEHKENVEYPDANDMEPDPYKSTPQNRSNILGSVLGNPVNSRPNVRMPQLRSGSVRQGSVASSRSEVTPSDFIRVIPRIVRCGRIPLGEITDFSLTVHNVSGDRLRIQISNVDTSNKTTAKVDATLADRSLLVPGVRRPVNIKVRGISPGIFDEIVYVRYGVSGANIKSGELPVRIMGEIQP